MRSIMAAIDGTMASDAVLDTAVSLGALVDRPVQAFHVSDGHDVDAAAAACRHGLPLDVLHGEPEHEVVGRFDADDVRIAVIGSRGTPHGPRPAGHLAWRALQAIRVPLVVVPPVVARPLVVPGPALIPLDGTCESADAVRPVVELLEACDVDLVVVHAFDTATVPRFWDRPAHEAEEWGREFRQRFLGRRPAPVNLVSGDPGQRIVQAAIDHEAALVVIGWACDLAAGHANTVRRVLAESTVPVLLVPTARA